MVGQLDTSASDSKFVVQARDFKEFLGRLGFVAQLLVWLKPHLAPLYAWGSAVAPGTVGKLPETVVLTLLYISLQLENGFFPFESEATYHFLKGVQTPSARTAELFLVVGSVLVSQHWRGGFMWR